MIKGLMLDLDISVIYIIIILGILLWALNKIFYRPVGNIINTREAKILKESEEIDYLTKKFEERSSEIEITLKNARRKSAKIREKLIKEGEKLRSEMLVKTREKANVIFTEQMGSLEKEIVTAEENLKTEIGTFTKKIERIFT